MEKANPGLVGKQALENVLDASSCEYDGIGAIQMATISGDYRLIDLGLWATSSDQFLFALILDTFAELDLLSAVEEELLPKFTEDIACLWIDTLIAKRSQSSCNALCSRVGLRF